MSKDRPCGARSFGRRLAPLLAGMALSANVQAVPPAQPNILLIIMDDVGIESLLVYNLGVDEFALTPKLDTWADTALRFDDAWTNPVCSPTRSTVLTGRYGFRTGIGTLVECDAIAGLDTDDPDLLPKVLGDPQRFYRAIRRTRPPHSASGMSGATRRHRQGATESTGRSTPASTTSTA